MIAYLPLSKAKKAKGEEKPDLSNRSLPPSKSTVPDFSKPDKPKTKDKNYKPAVMRGLPEPVTEGSVVEAHHPKHGMKVRGRVTAVGQDGYKMRTADGSALDVPHSHTIATLPVGDYGTETGVSPQDAKEAFLGPTKEGGLPATPLQIAIMDVLAQYGFPIDEDTIHTINYDQAKRAITKYIMDDRSSSQMPDADEDKGEESTGEATGEDQDQEDTGDDEDEDGPEATPMPPQGSGPENAQEGSQAAQASPPPPGAAGGAQSPSQAPTEPTDGTDVSQDGSGPQYQLDQDPAVLEDPEVAEAVKNLIAALQVNSTAPGTPDQEDISNPEQAKKHPAVKKKIGVLVNTAKNKK